MILHFFFSCFSCFVRGVYYLLFTRRLPFAFVTASFPFNATGFLAPFLPSHYQHSFSWTWRQILELKFTDFPGPVPPRGRSLDVQLVDHFVLCPFMHTVLQFSIAGVHSFLIYFFVFSHQKSDVFLFLTHSCHVIHILDLSEVVIPAGVFLHPAVGWG